MCSNAYRSTHRLLRHAQDQMKRGLPDDVIAEGYRVYDRLFKATDPEKMAHLLKDYKFEKQEHFIAIALNSVNQIIDFKEVTTGTVNICPVEPRECFRFGIEKNAVSMIFAHNHPSGSTEPSQEDINITRMLYASGKILRIPVLDHIIIGKGGFTSLCRLDPDMFERTMQSTFS